MREKHILSGCTVYHLFNGPTLSINYGVDSASKSGLGGKKKRVVVTSKKNGNLKFCPSGVIVTDGLQGGRAILSGVYRWLASKLYKPAQLHTYIFLKCILSKSLVTE